MSLYFKIILVIFGLAYFISPVDVIPDLLLPYIGWIDDGVVFATIIYMIRYGRLPHFLFKKKSPVQPQKEKPNPTHSTPKQKTPHDILGVKQTANKREIQAAYKEAIKKYHPDKLSHLGEEFSTLANEKFLEIQRAYDTLIKKF